MFVNVTGAFLLGVFVSAFDSHGWPASVRTLVAVGFLGSYTTFSTLMAASVELAQSGEFARAALNIGGSVLLGLAAALVGILIGRAL